MNKHASATGLLQGGQIPGFKVRGLYPCPKPCFPAVCLWMGHVTILQPSFLIKTNKHVKPGSTFLPFCLFHGKAVVIDMTAQALQQHKEPWSICAPLMFLTNMWAHQLLGPPEPAVALPSSGCKKRVLLPFSVVYMLLWSFQGTTTPPHPCTPLLSQHERGPAISGGRHGSVTTENNSTDSRDH